MKPTLLAAALLTALAGAPAALAAPPTLSSTASVASSHNDPYAQYALAERAMQSGDRRQAMTHYRVAARLGHTDAQWKLADILFRMADAPGTAPADATRLQREAAALLEHAATAGNLDAMRNLARRQATGDGIARDVKASADGQRRLAEAGDGPAAYAVAQAKFAERAGQGDESAMRYLVLAADAGYPKAVDELASRLEEGRGTPQDLVAAHIRATEAVRLELPGAEARLARIEKALLPPPVPTPTLALDRPAPQLVVTNIEPVRQPITTAPVVAAAPATPAPAPLAASPVAAEAVTVAPRQAASNPRPAAPASACGAAVAPSACADITALREQVSALQQQIEQLRSPVPSTPRPQRRTLPEEPQDAMPPLPAASGPALAFAPAPPADPYASLSPAQLNDKALAALRENDTPKALLLLDHAAKRGDVNAMNNLGMLHLRGTGVAMNRDAAVRWFTEAAERGNATAASNLGYIYANGIGVTANTQVAIDWYQQAVNLGHGESREALRTLQGMTGAVAWRNAQ